MACLCPWAHLLYLEPDVGGILKRLVDSASNPTAFVDAMKCMQKEAERKQLEEEESPYLAGQEDDPNWM